MNRLREKLINAFLASHHGVISRRDALELGLSADRIDRLVAVGRWAPVHRGVYVRVGETVGPAARLLAACLAAGPTAVASHDSAAWLWGLIPEAPPRPSVTVPLGSSARVVRVKQHRRNDIDHARVVVLRSIPVTDPLRTLVDLGATVDPRALGDAVDVALARKLVSVEGLECEIQRLARPGRQGVPALRTVLRQRGLVGAPQPSVLESRTLRLLKRWGITPTGAEVVVLGGRYRLDVLLCPGVALEVDGFSHHWSPEHKAADSWRRNQLRLAGIVVIEADWVTIMRDPQRLRAMVAAALRLTPGAEAS
jgi:hypothetical protein